MIHVRPGGPSVGPAERPVVHDRPVSLQQRVQGGSDRSLTGGTF